MGPSKSKKSALVTWLAGVADSLSTEPGPTVGCRILEAERNGVQLELWDVSGDQSYEAGWPAVQDAADAVIFVYNSELPGAQKEIELWAEWFASKTGMPAERCICWKLAGGGGAAGGGLTEAVTCPVQAAKPMSVTRLAAVCRADSNLLALSPCPLPHMSASLPAAPSLGPIPVESHSLDNDAALRKSFDRFTGRLIALGKLR